MKPFLVLTTVVIFTACSNNVQTKDEPKTAMVASVSTTTPVVKVGIEGLYSGPFSGSENWESEDESFVNKISIFIDSISDDVVYGHSIVAGNNRPFSGPVKKEGTVYKVVATEPGSDKYDGRFEFAIDNEGKLKGKWKANNAKLKLPVHEYELSKKTFTYDPALVFPESVTDILLLGSYNEKEGKGERLTADVFNKNPSKELLRSKDVENMYLADLEVLRNSIYARHGYSFKNRRMRALFDENVEWYMPVSTDVTTALTELEKKNIELLKRYEKHATKYYDSFGR